MAEVRARVTAQAAEFDGEAAVRIEIVVPVDQLIEALDAVVTTALAAKGLVD